MSQEQKDQSQPPAPQAPMGPPKSDTSRIDLADAEAPHPVSSHETLNIKDILPNAPSAPPKAVPAKPLTTVVKAIPAASPKTSTSRISLDAALSETDSLSDVAKDATVRVDLTAIQQGGAVPSAIADAQKNRTARIRIEEPAAPASDTAHIALGQAGAASDTAHIDLGDGAADETSHISLAGAPPIPPSAPPKTIRLQRPTTLPKTVVLPRPTAAAAGAPPKTVVLKRPDEEGESGKGATARILVPEGIVQAGPATQRKTIRIKRPDSAPISGGKTLVIARPTRPASVSLPASAAEEAEEVAREMTREKEPGVLFSLLALAATLVAAALAYILAAQTVAPNLPVPGLR